MTSPTPDGATGRRAPTRARVCAPPPSRPPPPQRPEAPGGCDLGSANRRPTSRPTHPQLELASPPPGSRTLRYSSERLVVLGRRGGPARSRRPVVPELTSISAPNPRRRSVTPGARPRPRRHLRLGEHVAGEHVRQKRSVGTRRRTADPRGPLLPDQDGRPRRTASPCRARTNKRRLTG